MSNKVFAVDVERKLGRFNMATKSMLLLSLLLQDIGRTPIHVFSLIVLHVGIL